MAFLSPLPVAVPLLVAALLIMLGQLLPRWLSDTISLLTSAALTVMTGLLLWESMHAGRVVYWFGGWQPANGVALGISFVIDPFGAGLAMLASVLGLAVFVYSWWYFKTFGELFHVLVLIFLASMNGFCLTGDVFNMFVFFELMSVAAYALTGYKIEDEAALMGSFSFAITGSIGAFLVLFGIALLYGRTGALNLAQIGQTLAGGPLDRLVVVAFVLILSGYLIKAAIVPFHFWLPDAHAVAPTPASVLFSGVMVVLGLYGAARVYWVVFDGLFSSHAEVLRTILLVIGSLSTIIGGIMCFLQRHLKRLLAFSTICHSGLFLIGVALLTPEGLAGTALYAVSHGLVKGALFMLAGILLNRYSSVDENVLHGKGSNSVITGVLFCVGGLALAGLPPFGTWLGKSLIESAAEHLPAAWFITAMVWVGSVLTGGAVLRATGHIFLGWGRAQNVEAQTPTREAKETLPLFTSRVTAFAPIVLLLVLACVIGLITSLPARTHEAAMQFADQSAYITAVLHTAPPGVARPAAHPLPEPDTLTGFMTAAGAVCLALAGLFWHLLPELLRRLWDALLHPVFAALRAIHNGHIGDYVLWLMIGMVALGGAFIIWIA